MADDGKATPWMDENGMLKSGRIFYPAKKSFRRAIKQVARSRKHFTVRDVLENLEKRFQTAPGAALPIVKDEMIKLLAKKENKSSIERGQKLQKKCEGVFRLLS